MGAVGRLQLIHTSEQREDKRVLGEVDQNARILPQEFFEGATKIGSWKRKARAKGKRTEGSKEKGGKQMKG